MAAQTLASFKEISSRNIRMFPNGLLLGLYKDLESEEVPLGGWLEFVNFHVLDKGIQKYSGWGIFSDDETNAFDKPLNYAFDFEDQSKERWFLVGNEEELFIYDRSTGAFASLQNGYSGSFEDRWQSAIINDKLVLVNIATKPQVFDSASPTTVADLSADANMPAGGKFILNSLGHLVIANIVEGSTSFPYRLRVSDFDPTVWTPDITLNEAAVFDLDSEIRGMAALGTSAFLVYTLKSIYMFTYIGLPYIYNVQKVVDDIGCFAPYSLISFQDTHYWLGEVGFYKYNGTGIPELIGVDRVDNFLIQSLYQGQPANIYAFAHPFYPEIWFTYQSNDGAGTFDKAVVYNWLYDVWSRREPFPHSALAEFRLDTSETFEDNTAPFDQATLTWRDKRKEGTFVVVGGTDSVFLHGQSNFAGDGATPIVGMAQTGDLWLNGWMRKTHHTRTFLDISNLGTRTEVRIGGRDKAGDPVELEPATILDEDCRVDLRLTARMYQLQLTTPELIVLSDISMILQPAGERV